MKVIFLKDHALFVGNGTHVFYEKGAEVEVEDKLASALIYECIASPTGEIKPRKLAEDEMLEAGELPAGVIETKVTAPEETKPAAPAAKKGKK